MIRIWIRVEDILKRSKWVETIGVGAGVVGGGRIDRGRKQRCGSHQQKTGQNIGRKAIGAGISVRPLNSSKSNRLSISNMLEMLEMLNGLRWLGWMVIGWKVWGVVSNDWKVSKVVRLGYGGVVLLEWQHLW